MSNFAIDGPTYNGPLYTKSWYFSFLTNAAHLNKNATFHLLDKPGASEHCCALLERHFPECKRFIYTWHPSGAQHCKSGIVRRFEYMHAAMREWLKQTDELIQIWPQLQHVGEMFVLAKKPDVAKYITPNVADRMLDEIAQDSRVPSDAVLLKIGQLLEDDERERLAVLDALRDKETSRPSEFDPTVVESISSSPTDAKTPAPTLQPSEPPRVNRKRRRSVATSIPVDVSGSESSSSSESGELSGDFVVDDEKAVEEWVAAMPEATAADEEWAAQEASESEDKKSSSSESVDCVDDDGVDQKNIIHTRSLAETISSRRSKTASSLFISDGDIYYDDTLWLDGSSLDISSFAPVKHTDADLDELFAMLKQPRASWPQTVFYKKYVEGVLLSLFKTIGRDTQAPLMHELFRLAAMNRVKVTILVHGMIYRCFLCRKSHKVYATDRVTVAWKGLVNCQKRFPLMYAATHSGAMTLKDESATAAGRTCIDRLRQCSSVLDALNEAKAYYDAHKEADSMDADWLYKRFQSVNYWLARAQDACALAEKDASGAWYDRRTK